MKEPMLDRSVFIHYGIISFYTAILHNLFLLYHVEMFLSVYHIDKTSFWFGEIVFLIWNSLNDPLFGWISDSGYLKGDRGKNGSVVISRLNILSRCGPLFALSFLGLWFAWTYTSIQFVVCLCLYDGFLTMIDLHHSALLADISTEDSVRTKLSWYCSIFSACGSLSVFISYSIWSRDSPLNFQLLCVALAGVALCGYMISTNILSRKYSQSTKKFSFISNNGMTDSLQGSGVTEGKAALKKFVCELFGQKNVCWFTLMNLVQVFHCHFNSNFYPLFLENLLGNEISPLWCSLLLGLSFVAPHINNLYFLRLCKHCGAYQVIRCLFAVKLCLGVLMILIPSTHIWILALFIISNRVFTEGTCKLLNLVISDLVDEDVVINKRPQAVSALMFGSLALLSKPGQTFAPLIGTWLLSTYTGHDVFQSATEVGSMKMKFSADSSSAEDVEAYRVGVFQLLVFVATGCAVIQIIAWSQFRLHGKRLATVKALRDGVIHTIL